jgi:hypothetical protein
VDRPHYRTNGLRRTVEVAIQMPNGVVFTLEALAVSMGQVTFKLRLCRPDGRGTYRVSAVVTKTGYEPGNGSTTFTGK